MEGVQNELGGIHGILESIDSGIDAIKGAIEELQKPAEESLAFSILYHSGIFPSIKDRGVLATATKSCEITHTVHFICSFAVVSDDSPNNWIENTDYGIFLCPQQWKMLRNMHPMEMTYWFKQKKWFNHSPVQTSKEGCDTIFLKFKKLLSKEVRTDNEIVLSMVFKIGFNTAFYFGQHWCQAAHSLFSEDDGVSEVGDCAVEHSACPHCKARLVCQKHEPWAEKVTCVCILKNGRGSGH